MDNSSMRAGQASSITLTFLFTDIEGSTQLWEQHPAAMKLALARHDAILRQAIETHGGQVFKTVGDAFCAAFPSAPDALLATLDAQQAISAENWGETVIKVRMGLHSGVAEQRDNDYFGPTLNRVARLMSAGHGGQTLLSALTRELVQPNLPDGVELRDMGERGLKDLIRPEHIYQLTAPGLQTDFPPLKTLETFRTNLPVQLTSFIGREKEISAVKSLMAEHRLTTLTGSGGTGKTRLSLQVAADLLDSFPDGVWFIEFAPLSDPTLVPQTVLTTLGLREQNDRSALEILTHYLRTKKILLILDNCEHLVEAAAQFADTMLHTCVNLRFLVSSREALGIAGEKAYHVRSLSTPKADIPPSVETAAQYEAINLFVDRAKTISSSFAITSTNVFAIAQICARLDGIPLAIELAAARVKLLKVEQIAERLNDRFRLLTGGSRTALPRQQTLRAMIDWSYDLLPESERVLLRRLSVFAGGWTLEAAETVCQGPGIDDYNVLDPLAQLVNKSLVVVDADDSAETRYRLLETVRQYAREKLSEIGEGMAVRDAHLQYFLGLAERAEPELTGPRISIWLNKVEMELDNIRVALEWAFNREAQIGLRLLNALYVFWWEAGQRNFARVWFPQLLGQPESQAHTKVRVRALLYNINFTTKLLTLAQRQIIINEALSIAQELDDQSGIALCLSFLAHLEQNPTKTRNILMESLTIYRTLDDKVGMANTLTGLGNLWRLDDQDNQPKRAYLDECLAICQEIGYISMMVVLLTEAGHQAFWRGDNATAHDRFDKALIIQDQLGRKGTITLTILTAQAQLAYFEGKYMQAETYYEDCLSRADEANDEVHKAWIHVGQGYLALRQGDLPRARALFDQSRQDFNELNNKDGLGYTLEGLASMAVLQGQYEQGERIFAWADAIRQAIDNPRPPVEQAEVDRDLATIRAHLDEAAFVAAQEAGRAMSMGEAIALALASTHD